VQHNRDKRKRGVKTATSPESQEKLPEERREKDLLESPQERKKTETTRKTNCGEKSKWEPMIKTIADGKIKARRWLKVEEIHWGEGTGLWKRGGGRGPAITEWGEKKGTGQGVER